MSAEDPYRMLIDAALEHVRRKDPSWDSYQPLGFRAAVVERWKKRIRASVFEGQIRWSLSLDDREFFTLRPLFGSYDIHYNPYRRPVRRAISGSS